MLKKITFIHAHSISFRVNTRVVSALSLFLLISGALLSFPFNIFCFNEQRREVRKKFINKCEYKCVTHLFNTLQLMQHNSLSTGEDHRPRKTYIILQHQLFVLYYNFYLVHFRRRTIRCITLYSYQKGARPEYNIKNEYV